MLTEERVREIVRQEMAERERGNLQIAEAIKEFSVSREVPLEAVPCHDDPHVG